MTQNKAICNAITSYFDFPQYGDLRTVLHFINKTICYNDLLTRDVIIQQFQELDIGIDVVPILELYDNDFDCRRWMSRFLLLQYSSKRVEYTTLWLNASQAMNDLDKIPRNIEPPIYDVDNEEETNSKVTMRYGRVHKLSAARKIVTEMIESPSSVIINRFVNELNMTPAGARTYLFKIKKELR